MASENITTKTVKMQKLNASPIYLLIFRLFVFASAMTRKISKKDGRNERKQFFVKIWKLISFSALKHFQLSSTCFWRLMKKGFSLSLLGKREPVFFLRKCQHLRDLSWLGSIFGTIKRKNKKKKKHSFGVGQTFE